MIMIKKKGLFILMNKEEKRDCLKSGPTKGKRKCIGN